MKEVILIDKKRSETPLQALEGYRQAHSAYRDVPMTYAGRLDPMADGLLLVLAGEKVHEKERYSGLDKVYEIDILLGFSTDTYDILGIVTDTSFGSQKFQREQIETILSGFESAFEQTYPPYSSKTVSGKPLWQYAREGENPELPSRTVKIFDIAYLGQTQISKAILTTSILDDIGQVQGDFRQKEIIKSWQKAFKNNPVDDFSLVRARVHCSSGTYMRSLAKTFGERMGIPALAYRITRTKIGEYMLDK